MGSACPWQVAGGTRGEQAEDGRPLQIHGRRREFQLEVHLPLRLSPGRADVPRGQEGERSRMEFLQFSGNSGVERGILDLHEQSRAKLGLSVVLTAKFLGILFKNLILEAKWGRD